MTGRLWCATAMLLGFGVAVGCARKAPPPGAERRESNGVVVVSAAPGGTAAHSDAGVEDAVLGTLEDNLPFRPSGQRLASIAWRTWVYTDVGPKRTRYGYLRAGAIVQRRGPPIVNAGCAGGWYRINPRGFVCIGKGATLDLEHPVVVASSRRAERGAGLPYLYALSRERAPHLYFKLPTLTEMEHVEGKGLSRHATAWRASMAAHGWLDAVGVAPEPPAFLVGLRALHKPYGVEHGLHFAAHAGQASSESGFAIASSFEWETRLLGLTTELDIIALDRTRVVRPSALRGIELGEGEDLPAALVMTGATRYERSARGLLTAVGGYNHRTALKLTGESATVGGARYWETEDDSWVPESRTRFFPKREKFPSVATGTRKWIDISIDKQTLVAYTGRKAVYATLVSTGAGGLGDPDKTTATVRGTFMIHAKHVSATMDGEEDKSDSFSLSDVPFVQYFHKGYALHGAYWHDEFGKVRSHGCVNLAPHDAAWLFEWTDPRVPDGWHAMMNKERGTVVHIHP